MMGSEGRKEGQEIAGGLRYWRLGPIWRWIGF